MQTSNTFLYSAAATRRLLANATRTIQIREFFYVVWVWVKGQRPTFISKRRYKTEFVASRQRAARALQVISQHHGYFGIVYTVTSSQPAQPAYQVEVAGTHIACTCEDWANQIDRFGKAVCKHGYATLQHLGHETLAAYLNR
ncbi:hypothetical protein [Stenomitos frigidus]|uniref:hypothetical protein n=1 Tax=Stenomitos frigidus TaxID=1886765 RepID=UPI0011B2A00C|nr:hypothetical protein [Stenomitos frigidus]